MADNQTSSDSPSIRQIKEFCSALLTTLNALESAIRRLHPPVLPQVSRALEPFKIKWDAARKVFDISDFPAELFPVIAVFKKSAAFVDTAIHCLSQPSDLSNPITSILTAMRSISYAQEILYPMHSDFDAVSRYFLEKPLRSRLEEYLGQPDHGGNRGIHEMPDAPYGRKGYFLYIPETWDEKTGLPLVVALHGGSGAGREFIWTWLKEARSRHFLLMAPSSTDRTWSFKSSLDADKIIASVHEVLATYHVPETKVLLTGFSDGAIYTLTLGLMDDSPFTALAPVSGALHPYNLHNAKYKRIYLVHGSLDWMFPVHYAHQTNHLLKAAGADIVFHEITDLSHTYPREENGRIIEWFDPALFLPSGEWQGRE